MNQVFNTSLKTKLDTQETLIDNAIAKLPKDVVGFDGANSGIVPKLVDQFSIKYTLPAITVDLNEKRVEDRPDNNAAIIYYLGYIGDGECFKYNPSGAEIFSLFPESVTYTEKNIEITVQIYSDDETEQTHDAIEEMIDPYFMFEIDNDIRHIVDKIRNELNQIASEIDNFNYDLKDLIYDEIMNRVA